MDDHQELGQMASQVESWFQAVTSITDGGSEGDIISPIDFVPPSMLQSGSERDVALHASKTMAPRADVIAAAIAAGQASVKTARVNQANMSGDKMEEKKYTAPKQRRFPMLPDIFPRQQKFQPIMMQQYMRFLRFCALALMVCCGIVLTNMTLQRLGHQGVSVAKLHHHTNRVLNYVRGKDSNHVDKHNKCPEWVSLGGCVSNPVFMKEACTKSCALRSVDTSEVHLMDNHAHCGQWTERGECLNNPKFMMMECAKSCSNLDKKMELKEASVDSALTATLPDVNPAPVTAQDKSEYCSEWALSGECQANAAFMLKECPKSCGSL